jgi:uncharacterized protein (DUF1501 family)
LGTRVYPCGRRRIPIKFAAAAGIVSSLQGVGFRAVKEKRTA